MRNIKNIIFISLLLGVVCLGKVILAEEMVEEKAEIVDISIDEVTQMALKDSLDIQIAKFDAYIKRKSLKKAESIFDPLLRGEAYYLDSEKDQASSFLGTKQIESNYGLGLEKKYSTGTMLQFDAQSGGVDSDYPFADINPYSESSLGLSLVQPLGKNFFGLAERKGIELNKIDIENAEYTSLDEIENSLYRIQMAYWSLVLRCEEVRIKKDMLNEAKKLYGIYQDKYKLNLVEKSDLLAIEANVKIRENDVLLADLERQKANKELLFLLNKEDVSICFSPTDRLEIEPVDVDLHQSLREALANRRDYLRSKNLIKMNDLSIRIRDNSLWPEIDLKASLVRNGLDANFADSWGEVFSKNQTEFFLGLSVSRPLGNRYAQAEREETELRKEQLLLSLKQTERFILKEVHNRVNEVNTLRSNLEKSYDILKLQRDKLEEEKKRLRYARTSSDILIRYEEDVLNAQISLALALFNYRQSVVNLDLTRNTLLNKYWKGSL
ncbi:MAG: TolC family protein [bacterium]